jgi:hypothetical protein
VICLTGVLSVAMERIVVILWMVMVQKSLSITNLSFGETYTVYVNVSDWITGRFGKLTSLNDSF